MTSVKFMVGPADGTTESVMEVLNQSYRMAAMLTIGREDVGLEDTVEAANAVEYKQPTTRVFRVSVEEVQ